MSGSLLKLLRELSQREIEYVVVGGMAAVLHGAPVVTADVDIVHRRTPENVNALLQVLRELEARLRYDTRKLFPSEAHLLGHGHILLATSLGPIDLLCEVQGEGYEELLPYAQELKLGEGLTTKVLGLEKLIEQKMGAAALSRSSPQYGCRVSPRWICSNHVEHRARVGPRGVGAERAASGAWESELGCRPRAA